MKIEHPPHQSLVMPSKLLTENKPYTTADKTDLAKLFAEVRRQAEKAGVPDMFTEQK
jgi:hypothetical protein